MHEGYQRSSSAGFILRGWSRENRATMAASISTIAIVLAALADFFGLLSGPLDNWRENRAGEAARASIRQSIKGHYYALGQGHYHEAYDFFGSVMRNRMGPEPDWIEVREEQCPLVHPHGAIVKHVRVSQVKGEEAVATADVRFVINESYKKRHKSEAWAKTQCEDSHWVFAWKLLEEHDGWKLASQISSGTHRVD